MKRLTVKDAVATAFVALAGGLYALHLAQPHTTFIGSARWTAVTLLVVGLVACATGGELTSDDRYQRTMSGLAAVPFLLMLAVLVTGNDGVLTALVAVIGAMWLVTTIRHALGHHAAPTQVTPPVQRELQHH